VEGPPPIRQRIGGDRGAAARVAGSQKCSRAFTMIAGS